MPRKIIAERLQEGLRTKHFGRYIFLEYEVDSTNEWAKRLARFGAKSGTVAVAQKQHTGRGRLGREWLSPEGGLWFSVILRPQMSASDAVGLVFVAGLAVAKVLEDACGLRVETKWPNDVLVDGKKISGILCEMSTKGNALSYIVIGVGINVNFDVAKSLPKLLQETATSVQNLLGRQVQIEKLFRTVLERLEETYDLFLKEGLTPVLNRWREYARFIGREIEISINGEKLRGTALDVDAGGKLILKLQDGSLKTCMVGDVSLNVQ